VIAVPFVLWLSVSAHKKLIPLLITVSIAICAIGIIDHARRPIDDYRDAALHLRGVQGPVVASGYLYLETIMVRPAIAFPALDCSRYSRRALLEVRILARLIPLEG